MNVFKIIAAMVMWAVVGGSIESNSLEDVLNATALSWGTYGDGVWQGELSVSHDGIAAAQSGFVGHNQSSVLKTTVIGPGILRFWWKVSSEENFDWLCFFIGTENSTLANRISGEKGWIQKSVVISSAGPTTVRWVYSKDDIGTRGSDCGWVDEVEFIPYDLVNVTFDAQGGTVSPVYSSYMVGDPYSVLPVPVRFGYNFEGWYTEAYGGGARVTEMTIATPAINQLCALWTTRTPVAWYVDAAQTTDNGDGRCWATACQSIQSAIDKAFDGDIVWVTNGVYAVGSTNVDETGNSRIAITKNITVCSVNGAANTIIRGSGVSTYGTVAAVRCAYLSGGRLEGFTLEDGSTGNSSVTRYGGGVYVKDDAVAQINACVIQRCKAYYGGGVGNGVFINCVLTRNNAVKHGGGSYNSCLTNCLIAGNATGTGSCSGGGSCFGELVSCTVVNNVAGDSGGVFTATMINSIVWGNSAVWGDSANVGECTLMYTCASPLQDGIGNRDGDPLFVDVVNGDYRLQEVSPCRDVGTNAANEHVTDLAGNRRITHDVIDLGAYEWCQSTTVVLTETQNTPVPVPFTWLDSYFSGLSSQSDYEAAAGHTGANGRAVWESYVAGLDPLNAASQLVVFIQLIGDTPSVTWSPNMSNRVYTVEYKVQLEDAEWQTWSEERAARFFRVRVTMPAP